jgi:hypothetical protein
MAAVLGLSLDILSREADLLYKLHFIGSSPSRLYETSDES